MKDTIVFMSAYDITKYSKAKLPRFNKKQGLDILLKNHHLTYMLLGDKLVSPKGTLTLNSEYDYIHQNTTFSLSLLRRSTISKNFRKLLTVQAFVSNFFTLNLFLPILHISK